MASERPYSRHSKLSNILLAWRCGKGGRKQSWAGTFLTTSSLGEEGILFFGSICLFLCCKYSHHGWFQSSICDITKHRAGGKLCWLGSHVTRGDRQGYNQVRLLYVKKSGFLSCGVTTRRHWRASAFYFFLLYYTDEDPDTRFNKCWEQASWSVSSSLVLGVS